MKLIATTILTLASVLIGACSADQNLTEVKGGLPETYVSEPDAAWNQLTERSRTPLRTRNESYFEHFVRTIELDRVNFRNRGVEFWAAFPNDIRRYEWLIITVAESPYYAKDLDDWVRHEVSLGPNVSAVDIIARSNWEKRYISLREEFWNSPDVSDEQRRSLWAFELRSKLLDYRQARARGGIDVDKRNAILDEIIEFALQFGSPLGVEQYGNSEMYWYFTSILELALQRDDVFGLTEVEQLAFADRLLQTGQEAPVLISEMMQGFGGYKLNSQRTRTQSAALEIFEENGFDEWSDLIDQGFKGSPYELIRYYLHNYYADNQPRSGLDATYAVFRSDNAISSLKFQELGIQYWDYFTLPEKLSWSRELSEVSPSYGERWASVVFSYNDWFGLPLDWRALEDGDARVKRRMIELMQGPGLSEEEVRELFWRIFWIDYRSYQYALGSNHPTKATRLEGLLEDLQIGLSDYVSDLGLTYAGAFITAASSTGVGQEALEVTFSPLIESENPDISEMARNVVAGEKLGLGSRVEIELPTLDGVQFSTANLEGKIVLIDHWDTNCAPCIAAFPRVNEVYKEYQERGFEVVSIAYDATSQRRAVDRIKSRMDLNWITLNGEGSWPLMSTRYQYNGFPQYMLLDRRGELIAATSDLNDIEMLEPLLAQVLAAEEKGYYEKEPLLWRVFDDDSSVYLYGTLHSINPNLVWFGEDAKSAFNNSDTVFFEVEGLGEDSDIEELRKSFLYLGGDSNISDFLNDNEEGELSLAIEEVGLAWEDIRHIQPWYIVSMIDAARLRGDGFDSAVGVEYYLQPLAAKEDKAIKYLASATQQLQYMADLSVETQVAYLMDSIRTASDDDTFEDLYNAWRFADEIKLEEVAIGDFPRRVPEVFEALVLKRNAEWSEKVSNLIDSDEGITFFAVGVGHLIGPNSLQVMLQSRGYSVERVH